MSVETGTEYDERRKDFRFLFGQNKINSFLGLRCAIRQWKDETLYMNQEHEVDKEIKLNIERRFGLL